METTPQNQPTSKDSFRWDIQALRAIAVLAVVIFHINPKLLPGGYIGVDMFFVISGYLIVDLIWRDLQNNTFNLLSFYLRRVKRLFPALLVMLIVAYGFTYVLFIPDETANFAESLIATIFYFSNFYFYSQIDYFNSGQDLTPLLHTWSLAVEEQFYFIFPLILLWIFSVRSKWVCQILLGIAIFSLLVSETLLYVDESLAFYSSPTRFFQFIIGGLLAIKGKKFMPGKSLGEITSLAGLLLIVICLLFYDEELKFPGLNAVLPSLATAIVIYAGGYRGRIYRLLANGLFKFFGKISYSLYLWHWPLITFYQSIRPEPMSKWIQIDILFISILLGYLSWKFVENTTRYINFRGMEMKPILVSLSISLVVAVIGFLGLNGLPHRYTPQQVAYSSYSNYSTAGFRGGNCFLSGDSADFNLFNINDCVTHRVDAENYLLIGDSHAAHFYSALFADKEDNETVTQVTSFGCKPTVAYEGREHCAQLIKWAYDELILDKRFNTIMISAQWNADDLISVLNTVVQLESYSENIIVMGPIVEYAIDLPKLLTKDYSVSGEGDLIRNARKYSDKKEIDIMFSEALTQTNATYLSVLDYICPDQESCDVVTTDDIPMQFDYGHLTHEGALALIQKMKLKSEI